MKLKRVTEYIVGRAGGEKLPHLSHEIAKKATGRLKNRQAHVCACTHAFVGSAPILSHGILCDAQTFSGNAINPLIISFHLQCTHDFNRLVHVSHEHTVVQSIFFSGDIRLFCCVSFFLCVFRTMYNNDVLSCFG